LPKQFNTWAREYMKWRHDMHINLLCKIFCTIIDERAVWLCKWMCSLSSDKLLVMKTTVQPIAEVYTKILLFDITRGAQGPDDETFHGGAKYFFFLGGGYSVQNLLNASVLTPAILRWILDFRKMFAPVDITSIMFVRLLYMTQRCKCLLSKCWKVKQSRFCRMETETVQHIICGCEALPRQHFNVFGKLIIESKDISTASVRGPLSLRTRHRVIESVLNAVFRAVQ